MKRRGELSVTTNNEASLDAAVDFLLDLNASLNRRTEQSCSDCQQPFWADPGQSVCFSCEDKASEVKP